MADNKTKYVPKYGYEKGKPDPSWWMEQIKQGEKFRKEYAQEPQWNVWRSYYRGNWPADILPTNLFFKMIRTLVPRIYYRNPSVSIIPTKPGIENILFAKILQRMDNKVLDIGDFKTSMKRVVQNAAMFGTGIASLGFGTEFHPSPSMEDGQQIDEGGRKYSDFLEYNSNIQPNMPWLLSVHPGDFVIPIGSTDFASARWAAQWIRRSLHDIQADSRFTNTDDIMSSVSSFPGREGRNKYKDKDVVDLVIIRDKKTRSVMVIAPYSPNGKKVIFEDDDSLQVNGGFPYYPLVFNQDDEVAWGVPDSNIIAPQQKEANETRTLIMRHRRISIVKILSEMGAITADEESKLISSDVAAVIKVSSINSVKVLEPGAIPSALLESGALINQEVQEILGLGVNQFGEYAPGSADRSATEAQIVNQATQIRIDERRDMVADMLCNVVKDMHHIMAAQWTDEVVVDLVGPQGVPIWLKVKPDFLKDARYDVKVDPDTSLPETKSLREQKAVQMYGLLRTNPLINPLGLTQFLLTNMYGVEYDTLLMTPLGNTSPQNPMSPAEFITQLQEAQPQVKAALAQWLTIQAQTSGQTPNANIVPS